MVKYNASMLQEMSDSFNLSMDIKAIISETVTAPMPIIQSCGTPVRLNASCMTQCGLGYGKPWANPPQIAQCVECQVATMDIMGGYA